MIIIQRQGISWKTNTSHKNVRYCTVYVSYLPTLCLFSLRFMIWRGTRLLEETCSRQKENTTTCGLWKQGRRFEREGLKFKSCQAVFRRLQLIHVQLDTLISHVSPISNASLVLNSPHTNLKFIFGINWQQWQNISGSDTIVLEWHRPIAHFFIIQNSFQMLQSNNPSVAFFCQNTPRIKNLNYMSIPHHICCLPEISSI